LVYHRRQGKPLVGSAAKAAYMLRGKAQGYYAPHQEMGDFVVIIKADRSRSGNKPEDKCTTSYRLSGRASAR
jgi:large subunit ribosomal protein L13